jgi:hypothetical protein
MCSCIGLLKSFASACEAGAGSLAGISASSADAITLKLVNAIAAASVGAISHFEIFILIWLKI